MSEFDSGDANDTRGIGGSGEQQGTLSAARERLNAAYETTREKSYRAFEEAEGYVRKSPLEAVGYAAAVGAVLGLIAGLILGRKD